MLFFKKKKKEKAKEAVVSFSRITIEFSGMSHFYEVEAVSTDSGTEVSRYGRHWGDDARYLEGKGVCDTDEFIALLNECDLIGWDGFNGEHPPGLLDGSMFRLEAIVNGDRRISAGGSGIIPGGISRLGDEFHRIIEE
ncbi:MAG: hypothetical protein IKQ60_05305 [Candidatus Methanomethylophilaceae archaeon]|nr:hypothetical protein [Candidatus Methanomethylophilaceae archaeon]